MSSRVRSSSRRWLISKNRCGPDGACRSGRRCQTLPGCARGKIGREGTRSSCNSKASPYHRANRDAVSRRNVAVPGAKFRAGSDRRHTWCLTAGDLKRAIYRLAKVRCQTISSSFQSQVGSAGSSVARSFVAGNRLTSSLPVKTLSFPTWASHHPRDHRRVGCLFQCVLTASPDQGLKELFTCHVATGQSVQFVVESTVSTPPVSKRNDKKFTSR